MTSVEPAGTADRMAPRNSCNGPRAYSGIRETYCSKVLGTLFFRTTMRLPDFAFFIREMLQGLLPESPFQSIFAFPAKWSCFRMTSPQPDRLPAVQFFTIFVCSDTLQFHSLNGGEA